MNRKWFGIVVLAAIAVALLNTSSCARDQQLVAITVQPSAFTFLTSNPTLVANFTALGTYIHPPETKDITAQVTWSCDLPQVLAVTSGGHVSPTGNGCGVVNLTASYNHGTGPSGNVVIGTATVTVNGPSPCP
jgi:hypothetical protein